MNHWTDNIRKSLRGRRLIAPAMALALTASVLTYEAAKPAFAKSPAVAPAAAALDDNSVGALLSLDHAMETLAARVTPATVNVAVTSKVKATETTSDDDGIQQFFGPNFRQFFGPNFRQFMRPQPQVEHVGGSGVIISPEGYI